MSVRTPLPIRLIKSRHVNRTASKLNSIGAKELGMNSNTQHEYDRFVSAYKPSALPYFAKSQLSQFDSSKELFTLPSLRAIRGNESIDHVYTTSDNNNNSINGKVQLFPQPSDEDSSDALLTRVKDAYAPGCNPHYIALPIPSTLLLSHTPKVSCNNINSSSIPVSVTSERETSIPSTFGNSYDSDQTKGDDHHHINNSVNVTDNQNDNGRDVHHITKNFLHHSQLNFNNVSESTASLLSTPAGINQWTSRWKGLTLLASDVATTSVIRNCAAMKLVSTTYRVLCRLPAGVSWNITQHLQSTNKLYTENNRVEESTATDVACNKVFVNDTYANKSIACKNYQHHYDDDDNDSQHNVNRDAVSLVERKSNKASLFLNPYVNEYIAHKEKNDDSCADTNEIPLYDIVTGSLPSDLVIEPLLSMNAMGNSDTASTQRIKSNTVSEHMEYGFVNYERKTLRSHGAINCFLRSRASSLSREFDERVNQRRRLQGLFLPITNVETHQVNVNKTKIQKNTSLQSKDSKIENNNRSNIAATTANDDNDDGIQTTQNSTSYYNNSNSNKYHPWLPESSLLSLSLDVASVTKAKATSNTERSLHYTQNTGNVSKRGKHVAFDFRLLTVAPMNSLQTKLNKIRGSSENLNGHYTQNGHSHQDTDTMGHINNEAECSDWSNDNQEITRVPSSSLSLEKLRCCYALYEVTGMNLTPDEVAAVFAAQHFYVLNDYVNDVALAQSIADVTARIRSTSVARLTKNNLSLSAQHFIKNGSVEKLVIVPLMQQPLVRAADCIIHKTHQLEELEPLQHESEEEEEQEEQTGSNANLSSTRHTTQIVETTNANEKDKRKTKKSNSVSEASASTQNEMNVHQPRHNSLHEQLLYEALQAHMSTSNNADNCQHNNNNFVNKLGDTESKSLLHLLPLGSGVECVEIVFPDPTLHSNLLTLQRLYQEFQESSSDYTHNMVRAKAIESLVFIEHNIHNSVLTNGDDDGVCEVPMVLGATMQNFAQVRFCDNAQTWQEKKNNFDNGGNNTITYNGMKNRALPFPTLPSIECSTSLAIPLLMNFTTWYGAHWLVKQLRRVHTSCSYEGQWRKWVKTLEREMFPTETVPAPASATTKVNAMSLLYTNWIRCIRDHLSCFLRLEELSEHICALCYEHGHTWKSCPLHLRSSQLFIQESVTSNLIGKETKEQIKSSPLVAIAESESLTSSSTSTSSEATKSDKKNQENFDLITDGMTVQSIEDVTHELSTSLTNHNQNIKSAHYTYNDHLSLQRRNQEVSPTSELSTVVNVPNKALTYTSRQARYEQNQYYREQANRFKPRHQQPIKIIRCVYCGGRHHISECSKLDKQNK